MVRLDRRRASIPLIVALLAGIWAVVVMDPCVSYEEGGDCGAGVAVPAALLSVLCLTGVLVFVWTLSEREQLQRALVLVVSTAATVAALLTEGSDAAAYAAWAVLGLGFVGLGYLLRLPALALPPLLILLGLTAGNTGDWVVWAVIAMAVTAFAEPLVLVGAGIAAVVHGRRHILPLDETPPSGFGHLADVVTRDQA